LGPHRRGHHPPHVPAQHPAPHPEGLPALRGRGHHHGGYHHDDLHGHGHPGEPAAGARVRPGGPDAPDRHGLPGGGRPPVPAVFQQRGLHLHRDSRPPDRHDRGRHPPGHHHLRRRGRGHHPGVPELRTLRG